MGLDDAENGCPEHVWRVRSAVSAMDGSTLEVECERCGATAIERPGPQGR